jgi:hypothetical protein
MTFDVLGENSLHRDGPGHVRRINEPQGNRRVAHDRSNQARVVEPRPFECSCRRKDFLPVEPQSALSFLFLLGAPRFT